MNTVLKIFLMLIALMLPAIPGCSAASLLLPDLKGQKMLLGIFGLIFGHVLLSSLVFVISLAGFEVALPVFLAVLIFLTVIFYFFNIRYGCACPDSRISVIKENKSVERSSDKYACVFVALVAMSVIYFIVVGITSFTESVSDWPGIGIWGLKAKIIYYTGSCIDVLTNNEIAYSHPEYPLGFPLMITWCCGLVSGFDDYLIKIIPYFWGVISFIAIYKVAENLSGRKNISLLLALFIASSTSYLNSCINMYSEMVFNTIVILGFSCLIEFIYCERRASGSISSSGMFGSSRKHRLLLAGLFLLMSSCIYKTEGILYLVAAVLGLAIFAFAELREVWNSQKRIVFPLLILMFIIFVLPWCLMRLQFGLSTRDFSLEELKIMDKMRFAEISGKFIHEYLFNWYNVGICCTFMILTAPFLYDKSRWCQVLPDRKNGFKAIRWIRLFSLANRKILFVLFTSGLVIFVYYSVFFASTMPLWWHLQAVRRILMLPSTLICLTMLNASRRTSGESPRHADVDKS